MISAATQQLPTVWGLDPFDIHARFWASYGVQIVRPGEPSQLVPHAELFMLIDPRMLAVFRLASILDTISWLRPDLVLVRLTDPRKQAYSERVVTDERGAFVRFQRLYDRSDIRIGRVALTQDREIASVWQRAPDSRAGWTRLRHLVRKRSRYACRMRARVFDAERPEEIAKFTRHLVQHWRRPDATVTGIREVAASIWAHDSASVTPGPAIRGPLWLGAGRAITKEQSAVGPAIAWDLPEQRPQETGIEWLELESMPAPFRRSSKSTTRPSLLVKRLFDIVFSFFALLFTLPFYPLIILAIALEDGFPIFFGHQRETLNGKQFKCWKFRSMRRDAEQMKENLQQKNLSDGPQFYIPDDPRMTRVGGLLRDLQLDELPQFWNVLLGDMSVVGPRPSPFRENQYCPPWREARLSVKPGITGLWQISRTREVGADFQEWIKYDLQYVERQSFWLDLWIIWRTVAMLFGRILRP